MKASIEEIYSKSTICDFLLMVKHVTICEIFLHTEVVKMIFKSPFSPILFWLQTLSSSRGMPSNININCTSLKSSGLQFCRLQYGSIFIHLATAVSQICEITQNSAIIQTYGSSGLSEVTNISVNRMHTCNFLLVVNSNLGCIVYRFRDIENLELENRLFFHPLPLTSRQRWKSEWWSRWSGQCFSMEWRDGH